MTRVLLVSNDHVNHRMAGPAIRAWELSRELARAGHEVTLASRGRPELEGDGFALVPFADHNVLELARRHDVVVFQGWILDQFPGLRDLPVCLVVDLYDPFPLEVLASLAAQPTATSREECMAAVRSVNEQVRRGDFFMCASDRQLDFWLGTLMTLNRINLDTYEDDRTLRSLIDVVPFGLPTEPPRKREPALRGVIPGIGEDDLLLLWGGGIYNWFDPLTLIRAVARAARRHPELRLVFLGTGHPNPDVPEMLALVQARELSEELGLTGRHVFFNEGWVPYDRRADWLLEADIGVSMHHDHLETRFSFRTRMLDYLWAGLPVICTAGDTLADAVERQRLGVTVPPEDPEAITAAIEELADLAVRREVSARVRCFAEGLTWERAASPLVRYCDRPRRAPDLAQGLPVVPLRRERDGSMSPLRRLLTRTGQVLADEGGRAVAVRGWRVVRRRLARFVAAG